MKVKISAKGKEILRLFDKNPKAYTKFLEAKDKGKLLFVLKVKGKRVHALIIGNVRKEEKDYSPEETEEVDFDE